MRYTMDRQMDKAQVCAFIRNIYLQADKKSTNFAEDEGNGCKSMNIYCIFSHH